MSSAAQLGQDWSFNEDLDNVSISIVGLEKHSKPRHIRSQITIDNGPSGLKVRLLPFLLILYCSVLLSHTKLFFFR